MRKSSLVTSALLLGLTLGCSSTPTRVESAKSDAPPAPAGAEASPIEAKQDTDVTRSEAEETEESVATAETDDEAEQQQCEANGREEEPAASLPTECRNSGKFCVPDPQFVAKLCGGKYPDVAVYMMQKTQPWTHGYIRSEQVDTINTLGGPTGEKLVFGEEVLVMRSGSASSSEMQVSGMGGYVVLRWDGTCATLAEHELVTWVPGLPRHAALVWKYLNGSTQDALLKSKRIQQARKEHRTECRGVRFGRSPQCVKATDRLNEAIVVAIRTGAEVPAPEHRP